MTQLDAPLDPSSTAATDNAMVVDDANCSRCGYNLIGLPANGVCPECGQPVVDSLKGFQLEYASREYIEKIRSGHSFILNGILIQIVFSILSFVVSIAFGVGSPGATGVPLLLQAGAIACATVILMGYLKATELDPGFVRSDKPMGARRVVRVAATAQVAIAVILLPLPLLAGMSLSPTLVQVATFGFGLLNMAAWAAQFFAMMLYTRWLASRIPDNWIIRRTKTYMWLLPILTTVGAIAIGLGPLIALVLYWNLLDRMRKHLKSIERTGKPAKLDGVRNPQSAFMAPPIPPAPPPPSA